MEQVKDHAHSFTPKPHTAFGKTGLENKRWVGPQVPQANFTQAFEL